VHLAPIAADDDHLPVNLSEDQVIGPGYYLSHGVFISQKAEGSSKDL